MWRLIVKGTALQVWGAILLTVAFLIGALGFALCATLIGAVIGIPMILVAAPIFIWGLAWVVKGRSQHAKEIIAEGIRQGIQQSRQT